MMAFLHNILTCTFNHMNNINLSKENTGVRNYDSPVSEMYIIGPQRVICDSETEHVGEDEGEW